MDLKIIDRLDPVILLEKLAATDRFAHANVMAGGGPFGSSLHIINLETQEVFPIGTLAANAVIATGIPSEHAEAQNLRPANQWLLRSALKDLKAQGHKNLAVLNSSSGQSCPACQAKQEQMARDLIRRGLLKPGHFIVTYGATFEDTAKIARFNDAPYVLDAIKALHEPHAGDAMLRVRRASIHSMPEDIRVPFMAAASSDLHVRVAVVHGTRVHITGREDRQNDLFATAEVAAIRAACAEQKSMEVAGKLTQPWLLGGRPENPEGEATLYAGLSEIGPSLAAEAKWAGIRNIVLLEGLPTWHTQAREVPEMGNAEFARLCWSGYHTEGTVLTNLRLMPFENTAQPAWRAKLNLEGDGALYNGLAGSLALALYLPEMGQRFTGHTILCPHTPLAATAPLRSAAQPHA